MPDREQTVFVVDDDADVLHAISVLLSTAGLTTRTFQSASAFLDAYDPEQKGCLILDIRMPDMDGLQLQSLLKKRDETLPIIFITGHGTVPTAVQAIKDGALEFLQKPFRDSELLDSIYRAMAVNRERRRAAILRQDVDRRLGSLTKRESQVMELMVAGDTNKVIARKLNISPRTVEIHRTRVMEKMCCETLAQLVHVTLKRD
ncbi:MAG TPA: DNA-binding response regulator [Porticoccaceae bacterium]|nr:DNA-binding response regulator [Porticoccaceae bacterium]